MIIKRDDRILDARYLSQEGDTGTRWWAAMRGRNKLSCFNGVLITSEVPLPGRPGQIVFSNTVRVYPPNTRVSETDLATWIGAWDFNVAGNPNLVTTGTGRLGAMDSDIGKWPDRLNTIGVLQTYANNGYAGSRTPSSVIAGPLASTATTGTTPGTDRSLTTYTLGCWIKKIDVSKPTTTEHLNLDSSTAANVAGFGYNNMHVGGLTVAASTNNPTGDFRHISVNAGNWVYYENGVPLSSGTGAPNPFVFDRVYVRGATQVNFDGANVSPFLYDNIVISAEALSAVAVAALAAGRLPDASGVLT